MIEILLRSDPSYKREISAVALKRCRLYNDMYSGENFAVTVDDTDKGTMDEMIDILENPCSEVEVMKVKSFEEIRELVNLADRLQASTLLNKTYALFSRIDNSGVVVEFVPCTEDMDVEIDADVLVDMNDDTYDIVQVRGRSSKGYLVEFDDRVEEVDFSSLLVFDGILQDENVIGSMLSMVSGGVEPGSPVVLNRSGMFALIFHNYSQN